jgi:hypothetical protein
MANEMTKKRLMPLYFIKEGKTRDDNSIWRQIGIAFEHKDGKGWDILFDVPVTLTEGTRLSIREPKEKEDATS